MLQDKLFANENYQVPETLSGFLSLKQRNEFFREAKTGKHQCSKITVMLLRSLRSNKIKYNIKNGNA